MKTSGAIFYHPSMWFVTYSLFFLWAAPNLGLPVIYVPFILIALSAVFFLRGAKYHALSRRALNFLRVITIAACLLVLSNFTFNYVEAHTGILARNGGEASMVKPPQNLFYLIPFGFLFLVFVLDFKVRSTEFARQISESQTATKGGEKRFFTFVQEYLFDAGILAVILTNVFYLGFNLLDHQSGEFLLSIRERFSERGSIPVATVAIFFWAMGILIFKAIRLNKEWKARDIATNFEIWPLNVARLKEAVQTHLPGLYDCVYANRLNIFTEYLENPNQGEAIAERYDRLSAIDRQNIESSFTAIRFIIWAMPVLGFLGTVWGISFSVTSLTSILGDASARNLSGDTLGPSLHGLAVAFDTTLVALILSLIAMFLVSYARKMEDDLVTHVDFFSQKLTRYFHSGAKSSLTPSEIK